MQHREAPARRSCLHAHPQQDAEPGGVHTWQHDEESVLFCRSWYELTTETNKNINKTKQNKTKQNKTKQNKTKQNKTKQNKTKQNKTKQNKTKQNKTKQNKTKQNKTKQNRSLHSHAGPLMRDVKNKICRTLDLRGLLDDDNGMELLVHSKIIKLDLPVGKVYENVWRRGIAGDDNTSFDAGPMQVVYRLQVCFSSLSLPLLHPHITRSPSSLPLLVLLLTLLQGTRWRSHGGDRG